MISKKTEEVLNRAVRYAFERRQEYFTLEHVLLSLLDEPEVLEVIQACGGSYTEIIKDLEIYIEKEIPKSQTNDEQGDEQFVEHPVATLNIQRLIQRALFHVQSAGKSEINPNDLLVALFQFKESQALYFLNKQEIERLDVVNYVSHGFLDDSQTDLIEKDPQDGSISSSPVSSHKSALKQYTVNLNQLALDNKIDPLVGRKKELDRIIQTLCRRKKNNPLLVGEAGVGKTALAEGLAIRINEKKVPDILHNANIYSLDIGSLLAGTKFRGDFEQRVKKVLGELQELKENGKKPILFIDEIHSIIGAGSVSGGSLDAANLLKPFLSRGEIQCMGSTTFHEFKNTFEKDHALARRFQKIEVQEPSIEEAVQILNGLKDRFEEHHRVQYTSEAIRAAVELSVKHLTDRHLPDKSIDILDETGAKMRLSKKKPTSCEEINETHIEEMVAEIARIPARSVSVSQKKRLKNLDRDLKLSIFGQDHAIETLVTAIRLARSGLRTGEKPVGSFLFCGPTGVGKTELSKQLAHCLGVPFVRFDMSEYLEKHTVSRLIGAPPGYVGFDQEGLLTDAVYKNPHSVILLDEFEKAHSDIWNILLQVMDHGFLTDHTGRKIDFRNLILIMTSNVGARDHERKKVGFAQSKTKGEDSKKAVEITFTPEFRNRLDGIVYFNPLDPVTIGQVVGKQLIELENQLLSKNVEIEINSDVREWLSEKGYDAAMGARPMARLIQEKLKKPLSEKILFGKLINGGKVKISLTKKTGEIRFVCTPRKSSNLKHASAVSSQGSSDEEST